MFVERKATYVAEAIANFETYYGRPDRRTFRVLRDEEGLLYITTDEPNEPIGFGYQGGPYKSFQEIAELRWSPIGRQWVPEFKWTFLPPREEWRGLKAIVKLWNKAERSQYGVATLNAKSGQSITLPDSEEDEEWEVFAIRLEVQNETAVGSHA